MKRAAASLQTFYGGLTEKIAVLADKLFDNRASGTRNGAGMGRRVQTQSSDMASLLRVLAYP